MAIVRFDEHHGPVRPNGTYRAAMRDPQMGSSSSAYVCPWDAAGVWLGEAAKATDVTRVLTLVAALFLPITFITGFYGMNFPNLPFGSVPWGWPVVTALMLIITVLSIQVFISKGWMGRPMKFKSNDVKGLNDAIRAPVQITDFTWQPKPGSGDTSGSAQAE